MIDFLYKSTCCLVLLYLFYWGLLKSEPLFKFNRFYLLGAIVLSMIIPFINIPITLHLSDVAEIRQISNWSWVSSGIEHSINSTVNRSGDGDLSVFKILVTGIYLMGACLMTLRFIRHIYQIYLLRKEGRIIHHKGLQLILSGDHFHPFSFLGTIFINERTFISQEDDLIIQHEGVHIRQLHSIDILLVEVLMIIFWFQPLIYLYRMAIALNHEFMADHYVSSKGSKHHYINKIFEMSNHRPPFSLASSFSFMSIKNRIKMMTQKKSSTKVRTIKTGLSVLVMVSLFITFSFSLKRNSGPAAKEPFVVILDAGHGGADPGSISTIGDLEKDIVFSISQKVKQKLTSENWVKVYATRDKDIEVALESRVIQTKDADLLLSIHGNSHRDDEINFKDILYSADNVYADKSLTMAKLTASMLSKEEGDVRLGTANYYVLKNAKCPALLINVGFLSNPEEASILHSDIGQEKIADKLYHAIISLAQ